MKHTLSAVVIIAAVAVGYGASKIQHLLRPPVVGDVTIDVPDHYVGINPIVSFSRTAAESEPEDKIDAYWNTTLRQENGHQAVTGCAARDSDDYYGRTTVHFPLYIGMPGCHLEPGRYFMRSCWEPFDKRSYRETCEVSNVFTVRKPRPSS